MKKKVLYLTFSIILLIGAIIIIVCTMIPHIEEAKALEECLSTPGCNWCTGLEWTMGKADKNYFISVLMIGVSILMLLNVKRNIKKEKVEE